MIRLGTRGSPLALAQAKLVAEGLRAQHGDLDVALHVVQTQGDEGTDTVARGLAGKALFTQRIEEALVDGHIDAAVHSLKDLPNESLPGVVLAAVPTREDPRDVLVSHHPGGLDGLPRGARVGTSSLRRSAQLLHTRPDLQIESLSGNVGTRLRKLDEHGWDGIVLAAAGLKRLGIRDRPIHALSTTVLLPAPGQGALAIQAKLGTPAFALVQTVEDPVTRCAIEAERAFSSELGADCNVPVAALAMLEGSTICLEGCVASPDGSQLVRASMLGPQSQAKNLGRDLAQRLVDQGARELLEVST